MNKEFLEDYEARKEDEIRKFTQKFRHRDGHPPPDHLRLNKPYSKSIAGEEIWTQIPLYGTTIIALKPVKEQIFEKVHGFRSGKKEIERIIEFAKETVTWIFLSLSLMTQS